MTLETLSSDGLLDGSISTAEAVIPGDAEAQTALGYLHANCGSCHGGARPAEDLTMFIPVGMTHVEDTPTYQLTVNQPAEKNAYSSGLEDMPETLIVPGDPDHSALVWRMQQRDAGDAQMPPLATEIVDSGGVEAVAAWIESL